MLCINEKTSDFSLPDSYSVKRVKDESAAKSLQQSAIDFIQSRLYGPGTKRTSSKMITLCCSDPQFKTKFSRKIYISVYFSSDAELLSLKMKKGAGQGASVEFVNKKYSEY